MNLCTSTSSDLTARFEHALTSLTVEFEPIVEAGDLTVIGYQAIPLSREPGMGGPLGLNAAAARLGRLTAFGELLRARVAAGLEVLPADALVFVPVHPDELSSRELFSGRGPLYPARRRVVFELSEEDALPAETLARHRLADLRDLGYRLAISDFGFGAAEVKTLVDLEPEVVKIHRSLVTSLSRQRRVRVLEVLAALCRGAGTLIAAEGIETADQCESAMGAGCDLLQGEFFGATRAAPTGAARAA